MPGRGPLCILTRLCRDPLQVRPAQKARAEPEEPGTPPSSPLSPEQLVRIQKNKAAALLRLAARNVPVGFGESWKQHLSGEFGKPYFIKVNEGAACIGYCFRSLPFSLLHCPFHVNHGVLNLHTYIRF